MKMINGLLFLEIDKKVKRIFFILSFLVSGISITHGQSNWILVNGPEYSIYYSTDDVDFLSTYQEYFNEGVNRVEQYFGVDFKDRFNIYIHPDRSSLDSAWQNDWGMPDFHSECWMVASGVSTQLDIISPFRWDSLSCEHRFSDIDKTQNLITHELVHVFHGQHNVSPDFSEVFGMDWFVEGIATYASGQLDSARLTEVQEAIKSGHIPKSLDEFWTGNLKYGLSGSLVMFLEKKYGREMVFSLLDLNHVSSLYDRLNTNESDILAGWKHYLLTGEE